MTYALGRGLPRPRRAAQAGRRTRADADASMTRAPRVGLFVTCLVDLFRPQVGFAAAKLLEQAGCDVEVPRADLLRPAGLERAATQRTRATLARTVIATFEPFDYVVVPSGSCAGMMRVHYPALFKDDAAMARRAPTRWRRRRTSCFRFWSMCAG